MQHTDTFLDWALAYARRGWFVFPIVAETKGAQLVPHWNVDSTLDEAVIRGWWQRWPTANVALDLHRSGLLAIDVDARADGIALYAELEANLGPLDRSCVANTQDRGLHIVCHDPGFTRVRGKSPGIDYKHRGYILVQPSRYVRTAEADPHCEPGSVGVYRWATFGEPAHLPHSWVQFLPATSEPAPNTADLPAYEHDAGTLSDAEYNSLVEKLLATGPRGQKNKATWSAIGLIYHDYGLGFAQGDVLLREWNETPELGPPRAEIDLMRQRDRALASGRYENERGGMLGLESFGAAVTAATAAAPPLDLIPLGIEQHRIGYLSGLDTPVVRSFPTQFPRLNELLGGGLSTRQVTTIMGGPAVGKTAFLLSLLLPYTTAEKPIPVLIISTEIEAAEIAARCAAPTLGRPWRDLVRDASARPAIVRANADKPLYIFDPTHLPTDQDLILAFIRGAIQAVTVQCGQSPIVAIDYLQNLVAGGDSDGARQRIEKISTGLVAVVRSLDVSVVAVSSVGRSAYGANLEKIRESENALEYLPLAKESGKIEFDAGSCLFIDALPSGDRGRWRGNIVVCKSRHGETGFAGISFDAALGIYSSAAYRPTAGSKQQDDIDAGQAELLALIQANPGVYSRRSLSAAVKVRKSTTLATLAIMLQAGTIQIVGSQLMPGDK